MARNNITFPNSPADVVRPSRGRSNRAAAGLLNWVRPAQWNFFPTFHRLAAVRHDQRNQRRRLSFVRFTARKRFGRKFADKRRDFPLEPWPSFKPAIIAPRGMRQRKQARSQMNLGGENADDFLERGACRQGASETRAVIVLRARGRPRIWSRSAKLGGTARRASSSGIRDAAANRRPWRRARESRSPWLRSRSARDRKILHG